MSDQEKLKILVFGAGAIGTYIGGSLALNDHQVTFIERPPFAEKIRLDGLRLQLQGVEHQIPEPKIVASLSDAMQSPNYDVGILALKSYDTSSALQEMLPHQESLPPILCLQNGVENEEAIAEVLGVDKVIPGTVTSSIGRRGAGDIVLERLRGIGIAHINNLAERIAGAMNASNLNAKLYPRSADMKWSKMLTNLLANASAAILDMHPAEIISQPDLFRLEMMQLREALDVMDVQNIKAVDLPATPVRLLTIGVRYIPVSLSKPMMLKAVGGGRGGKMPSFHIDLYSGRGKSEVDFLNGAIVRFGKRLGVATPVNHLLNNTLMALVNGSTPLDTYRHKPERLFAELQSDETQL